MANCGLQIKIQIQRNGNTKENTDMMKSKRMTELTNGEDYLLFEYEYNWKYKYKYKYKQKNDVHRDDDKWRRLIGVCSTEEIFV